MAGPCWDAEQLAIKMSKIEYKTEYEELYDRLAEAGFLVAIESNEEQWNQFAEVIRKWVHKTFIDEN